MGVKHPTKLKRGSRSSSYTAVLKRVGTTPEARADWLIRLANVNWDVLSAKERMALRQECHVFVSSKNLYNPNSPLIEEAVLQWRTEIRGYLDQLKNNKGLLLDQETQYAFWVRNGKLCYEFRATPDQFKAEVFNALTGAGKHFRFCLHCQTPFVTTHRQKYCTNSCSQKVRIQRYKDSDPERWRERARVNYERQRQKANPEAKLRFQTRGKSKGA